MSRGNREQVQNSFSLIVNKVIRCLNITEFPKYGINKIVMIIILIFYKNFQSKTGSFTIYL